MIEIAAAAREYVLKRGGCLHLYDYGNLKLCCGQMNPGPSVRIGLPPDQTGYECRRIDGIDVYLPNGFSYAEKLTIQFRRVLCFDDLYLDGWKLL